MTCKYIVRITPPHLQVMILALTMLTKDPMTGKDGSKPYCFES